VDEEIYVNKHTNILIVGKAATDFARKEVVYSESLQDVLEKYGESPLADAFCTARRMGVEYIFLMNLKQDQDYFDVVDTLADGDFAYVVFTSLFISDTFRDTYDSSLVHFTFAYLLGAIGKNGNSTYIITDKHASLYEDIDSYLDDMRTQQKAFLRHCSGRSKLRNVIFVANNLKDYPVATVPLAAALCATPINEYPTSQYFGEAIFDIDQWDYPLDMAYFKSNVTRETTVENLLNMDRDIAPEKVVFVDRLLKYIMRELDFQEFKGKIYRPYYKMLFNQKLVKYMDSLLDFIVKEYTIDSIEAYYDEEPGTVSMLARMTVLFVGCLESCTIEKGVEVG